MRKSYRIAAIAGGGLGEKYLGPEGVLATARWPSGGEEQRWQTALRRPALLWRRSSCDEPNPSQPSSRREEAGRLAVQGEQHGFPSGRMLVPPDNVGRYFPAFW